MTDGKTRIALPYRLILSILMGVVLLYLAGTCLVRTHDRLALRDRLDRAEQEVAAAEKANAELKAQLDYVSSNDATEEWARDNGWAREDEVLVVVLAPDAENADHAQLQQEEESMLTSNRDSWWELFFGER
jgi:hypothetical protein